jgi:hypothetical protein
MFLNKNGFSDIVNNNVLNTLYRHIKDNFSLECYLDKIKCMKSRQQLTHLRISAHNLRIESCRYGRNRLERHERICQLCNTQDIEDEFHFILVCNLYQEIRTKFIKNIIIKNLACLNS